MADSDGFQHQQARADTAQAVLPAEKPAGLQRPFRHTLTEPFRINLPDQIGMDRINRNRPGLIIAFHHVPPS